MALLGRSSSNTVAPVIGCSAKADGQSREGVMRRIRSTARLLKPRSHGIVAAGWLMCVSCGLDQPPKPKGPYLTVGFAERQLSTATYGRTVFIQAGGGAYLSIVSGGGHHRLPGTTESVTASCPTVPDRSDLLYLNELPDGKESVLYVSLLESAATGAQRASPTDDEDSGVTVEDEGPAAAMDAGVLQIGWPCIRPGRVLKTRILSVSKQTLPANVPALTSSAPPPSEMQSMPDAAASDAAPNKLPDAKFGDDSGTLDAAASNDGDGGQP
jgi:hypothetical protein